VSQKSLPLGRLALEAFAIFLGVTAGWGDSGLGPIWGETSAFSHSTHPGEEETLATST
jgi:hypothetical protein